MLSFGLSVVTVLGAEDGCKPAIGFVQEN